LASELIYVRVGVSILGLAFKDAGLEASESASLLEVAGGTKFWLSVASALAGTSEAG
jgi:hypothetical protein